MTVKEVANFHDWLRAIW